MFFETLEDICVCIFVISMEYSLFALQYLKDIGSCTFRLLHYYRYFVMTASCCFFWLCYLGCDNLPQRERRLKQALGSLHIDSENESHLKQ